MKLADDFLVKCLNYKSESERILKGEKTYSEGGIRERYWRNYVLYEMCKSMFIVEEADFNIAIELCKEYKRGIQKKAYEHKLNQFKETGIYPYSGKPASRISGNPAEFITELRNELCGTRIDNTDKRMLVNKDLKKHFPEQQEITAAFELLAFVSETDYFETKVAEAQEQLEQHQAKLNSIHEATDAGKSVLEIVEQLDEHEQD